VGLPPEWGLGGRADVRLTVQGRSGDPRWRFEGRAGRPAFGGHAADSLSLVLSGGPHRLQLEDGRYELAGGTLRAAGAVERTAADFPDSLSATALVRWLRDAAGWRAEITSEALPVAPFIATGTGGSGWNGLASGRLTLSGSPAHPVADVDAEVDGFGWRDIKAERVELAGHYADGWFVAPKITARRQNVQSTASIRLPLELALGAPPRVPELPIQGQVDIPAGDLQVLPLIVPQLQSAHGRFQLRAQLGGTPRAIQLSGTGQIRDGVVRPINRSEVFQGLNADLHFDQKQITLDTLWASQGRAGRATANGNVLLQRGKLDSYRFTVSLRDVAAAEEGLYAVLFDGDFVVSDGPRIGGEVLPAVTGQAILKRGVIEFDFANQSEVEKRAATTQPLYWTYRLQLEATNNLRWRTNDADLELDADLDLQQTADSLLIYGEMRSLRGSYWFLSNRFKINTASITFDNQQGVDPLLNVEAEAKVPSSDPKSRSQETITAKITGRSSQPLISLVSSEGADQKSILAALTVRGFRTDGSQGISADPLDNYFTQKLNAQLSAGLSEFFAGAITDWELQRDRGGLLTGEGALVVGVGSQVTDQLALRYQQRLPGTGGDRTVTGTANRLDSSDLLEQSVEAEFRVNRFIYLTSGVSRRRVSTNALAPTTDYNVNLKARWEY
jgi:autotransporter translocation and assembly factor TamB